MTRLIKILYRRDLLMGDQSINPYKTIFNTFNHILNLTNLFLLVLVVDCRWLIGIDQDLGLNGFWDQGSIALDSLGHYLLAWYPYYYFLSYLLVPGQLRYLVIFFYLFLLFLMLARFYLFCCFYFYLCLKFKLFLLAGLQLECIDELSFIAWPCQGSLNYSIFFSRLCLLGAN